MATATAADQVATGNLIGRNTSVSHRAPPRFFEVPPEDVDERVRRQADRWAARAAAVLGLRALGVAPGIRWFLRGVDLKRIRPTRTDLDAFTGPPSLAGLVHPDDPVGTVRLRGDLAPTLAPQQLAHYLAHELRHVWQHAQGRPWSRDVEVDVAAEHDAERFAADFVAQLKREERPMAGKWVVLNGRLQLSPETEEARHARIKARLETLAGADRAGEPSPRGEGSASHPQRVAALVQAATLATTPGELGRLLTTWTDALDAGELSRSEAETVLDFVEEAHTRLEAKAAAGGEYSPPAGKATSSGASSRRTVASGDDGGLRLEYGDPQPIARVGVLPAGPRSGGSAALAYKAAAPAPHAPSAGYRPQLPRYWVDGDGTHVWSYDPPATAQAGPLT